jgi:hypothetical protein
MFWSQRKDQRQQLREELRLRLRVAADFATLGAYELSEHDDVPPEPAHREQPPQRVFLFAKVAPVCPHSAPAERTCSERRTAKARTGRISARRRQQRQRGGAVRVPEQPCICPAERVPST